MIANSEPGYEGAGEWSANELIKDLESDCVCEKKEEVRTPSDKCLHGYLLTEPCKHCYFDAKYSKYACKHGIVSFGTVETICNYCSDKKYEKQIHSSESKEVRNLDCPNKCTVEEAVDRGCIYCAHKAVYKSKQSQYPCEHTLSIVEIHDHTYKFTPRLWYCINPGCGLVTCLNPNDK